MTITVSKSFKTLTRLQRDDCVPYMMCCVTGSVKELVYDPCIIN